MTLSDASSADGDCGVGEGAGEVDVDHDSDGAGDGDVARGAATGNRSRCRAGRGRAGAGAAAGSGAAVTSDAGGSLILRTFGSGVLGWSCCCCCCCLAAAACSECSDCRLRDHLSRSISRWRRSTSFRETTGMSSSTGGVRDWDTLRGRRWWRWWW